MANSATFAWFLCLVLRIAITMADEEEMPGLPTQQLDDSSGSDSSSESLCQTCHAHWSGLLSASCGHCTGVEGPKDATNTDCNQILPEGSSCSLQWDNLYPSCVLTTNPNQVCTIAPEANPKDEDKIQESNSMALYGTALLDVCGTLISACNSNTECSEDLSMYVNLVTLGAMTDPQAYCSAAETCGELFEELLVCASTVASFVPCSSDADCPSASLTCSDSTGLCTSVQCCSDLSDLSCCGCLYGGLSATQFHAKYCTLDGAAASLNSPLSVPTVHPLCVRACNSHAPITLKYARSGCHDSSGWHDYGDTWTKGCTKYTCNDNGKISKSTIKCQKPSCPSKNQVTYYGQCCPTCKGCKDYDDNWKTCGTCDYKCPDLSCPDKYYYTPPGECCPICQGCKDSKGKWHYYGEQWQSDCKVYSCESDGSLSWVKVHCDDLSCPSKYQKVPSGQCCPVCKACLYGGSWEPCQCSGCDDLSCPKAYQYTPAGECCPKCQGCEDSSGKWHHTGDKWQKGCTTYECTSTGYIPSSSVHCPSLSCPESYQVTVEGQCCPTCQGCKDAYDDWHLCKCKGWASCDAPSCPAAYQYTPSNKCCPECRGCKDSKGKWHYIGDTWQNGCDVYVCTAKGSIKHKYPKCPPIGLCPKKYVKTPSGQCCPVCTGCKNSYGQWHSCGCSGNCDHLSCDKEYQVTQPGQCCPTCKGCQSESGDWYHYGEVWQEDCYSYVCQYNGKIAKSGVTCPKPSCPTAYWVTLPDQCCPICRGCQDKYDHKWYQCTCSESCPELDCPSEYYVDTPNQCCPSCSGCKDKKGDWHYEGDSWYDGCNHYTCNKGKIKTSHVHCDKVPCPKKYQVILPGKCCPYCKACQNDHGDWYDCDCASGCDSLSCPEAFRHYAPGDCCPSKCSGCKDKNDDWHVSGEVWQDKCKTYKCQSSGKIKSYDVACPTPACYGPLVTPPDRCCPVCLD